MYGMHGRKKEGGQAMVEFALVVGLFLFILLGAVSASVYTVQRSAAVTGVTAGARIAAGGTPGASGANTPDLADAVPAVAHIVAPVMAGTRVDQVPPPNACPDARAIPRGQVDICATSTGGVVTVRLRGRPANALPIPGLDWALDLVAEVHAVTFTP
jgi:hypothetical protein